MAWFMEAVSGAGNLSRPLTQEFIDRLRKRLEAYGDQVGLEELACLIEPTGFDFQRLLNLAESRYGTRADVSHLEM